MRLFKVTRTSIITAALVLAALAMTLPAGATVLRFVPFEEQVDSAGVIVVAVMQSQSSRMTSGLIFTDFQFRVEETVKGNPGTNITVRVPGGEANGVGQSVDGAPKFESAGRYVLFLEPINGSLWRVVGFSQGSYTVSGAEKGKQQVAPQMAGAAHVEVLGATSAQSAGAASLEEFLGRVRGRMEGKKARSVEQQ